MCHTIIIIMHRNNLHALEKNIISETRTPITAYFRTRKFDTIIYHNINNNIIRRRRRRTFQTSVVYTSTRQIIIIIIIIELAGADPFREHQK